MWAITINGIKGILNPRNVDEADELCKTLLYAGYDVKVNALRVVLNYGPGYDTVIWAEGDFNGSSITELVQNR